VSELALEGDGDGQHGRFGWTVGWNPVQEDVAAQPSINLLRMLSMAAEPASLRGRRSGLVPRGGSKLELKQQEPLRAAGKLSSLRVKHA
jgi:hypothetical protein